jgi:DNA mismatch repair protein MSH3
LDAIGEILNNSSSPVITKLNSIFKGLPDLERGLSRISLGKVTSAEVVKVLQAFYSLSKVFDSNGDAESVQSTSSLINRIKRSLPSIRIQVEGLLSKIDVEKAKIGAISDMFVDETDALAVSYRLLFSCH